MYHGTIDCTRSQNISSNHGPLEILNVRSKCRLRWFCFRMA